MKTVKYPLILTIPTAALALACQSGDNLFRLFASSSEYTIVYSDSGPRTYVRPFGGFYSFLNQSGVATGRWTAVYLIGDSLRVTEFLSTAAQCPFTHTAPVGTDTLAVDSATVMVLHNRIRFTRPDPLISLMSIDSAAAGEVWGHFSISVHQIVPEFTGANATITGRFDLSEIEHDGHLRHCSGAA